MLKNKWAEMRSKAKVKRGERKKRIKIINREGRGNKKRCEDEKGRENAARNGQKSRKKAGEK